LLPPTSAAASSGRLRIAGDAAPDRAAARRRRARRQRAALAAGTAARAHNAMDGMTWVHSYVNPEKTKTFCIYDGPSPEAIRTVAERNKLPVDRITEVSVLDPYFYRA